MPLPGFLARPFARLRPATRRGRARLARFAHRAALSAPAALILVADLVARGRLLASYDAVHLLAYAGGVAYSFFLWGVLLYAAAAKRGRLPKVFAFLFWLGATLVLGVQSAFYGLWGTLAGFDAIVFSPSFWPGTVADLPLGRPLVWTRFALAAGLAFALLELARAFVRARPKRHRLAVRVAPIALVVVCSVPASYHRPMASPPDQIYFHGLGASISNSLGVVRLTPLVRPFRRHPAPLPPLARAPSAKRNVVLILEESQRYDVTCVRYDPSCALATPFTNKLVPGRIPLLQMRSNDSATAISLVVLMSGLSPAAPRAELEAAPLLWDYAKAAGYETVYWSAHHPSFEGLRLWTQDSAIDRRAMATSFDPDADFDWGGDDFLLADLAVREWDHLKEPFFAVINFSNPHYPYKTDPSMAPWQPLGRKPPESNSPDVYINQYKDAVYRSDAAVAKVIEKIRASESGPRTVIVYSSDHGEDIGSDWGHTWSIDEAQVHVPAWIDAPRETLSPDEDLAIRRASTQYLWHLDLSTTLLDLLGLWDLPEMTPYKARMLGHPITRNERTTGPVPLSNCAWVWGCYHPNWGGMIGSLKLVADERDKTWRCFDLRLDPGEKKRREEAVCRPAIEAAARWFPDLDKTSPPYLPLEPALAR